MFSLQAPLDLIELGSSFCFLKCLLQMIHLCYYNIRLNKAMIHLMPSGKQHSQTVKHYLYGKKWHIQNMAGAFTMPKIETT